MMRRAVFLVFLVLAAGCTQATSTTTASTTTTSSDTSTPVAPKTIQIGLNQVVGGWVPLDDGFNVWVAGPGTLARVDRRTGRAEVVARGAWDYDYVHLDTYGEGTIRLAEGATVWTIADGTVISQQALGLGEISAIIDLSGNLWVAATGPGGGVLARIDGASGAVLERYPLGQGVYQLAEAAGYLFVGTNEYRGPAIWRLDLRTGTFIGLPDSTPGPIATVGTTLWVGAANALHCIDARRLTPCGDVYLRAPAAMASDGGRLWVLSATGSTSAATYEPDPKQPATVTLLDGTTGQPLAEPVALPDMTPARITAFDGHAWVGFHDSGRLVWIGICAADGCRPPHA